MGAQGGWVFSITDTVERWAVEQGLYSAMKVSKSVATCRQPVLIRSRMSKHLEKKKRLPVKKFTWRRYTWGGENLFDDLLNIEVNDLFIICISCNSSILCLIIDLNVGECGVSICICIFNVWDSEWVFGGMCVIWDVSI